MGGNLSAEVKMWPTGTQLLVKPPWKLKLLVFDVSDVVAVPTVHAQLGESFSKHLWFAIVIVFFWLKWAGYLAVAGLNLLAQISDRISPFGV